MTIEEFNKELSKLLTDLFHGIEIGSIPIRISFRLHEEFLDPNAPLRVDLTLRRVWKDD